MTPAAIQVRQARKRYGGLQAPVGVDLDIPQGEFFGLLGPNGAGKFVAGLCSDRVDPLAAFQNFVILPFTFLSGVFCSIHSLAEPWQSVSRVNPFFYMIDGFRYGFFGQADAPPQLSAAIVAASWLALSLLTLWLLKSGYKLRR